MGEITLSLESPKMLHLRDIGEVGSKVETNIILQTKGFGSSKKNLVYLPHHKDWP